MLLCRCRCGSVWPLRSHRLHIISGDGGARLVRMRSRCMQALATFDGISTTRSEPVHYFATRSYMYSSVFSYLGLLSLAIAGCSGRGLRIGQSASTSAAGTSYALIKSKYKDRDAMMNSSGEHRLQMLCVCARAVSGGVTQK